MSCSFTRVRFGLGMVLIWATDCVAESQDSKNDRLGFKFDPQVHAAATAAASVPSAEVGRESEMSEGEILHLEKVVVAGKKIPFNSRDVLTPKGRLELAKKTYLTPAYEKTFGPLGTLASYYFNPLGILGGWHPNDAEALALYEDAAQKRRDTEMKELEGVAAFADPTVPKLPVAKPLDRKKSGFVVHTQGGATP